MEGMRGEMSIQGRRGRRRKAEGKRRLGRRDRYGGEGSGRKLRVYGGLNGAIPLL